MTAPTAAHVLADMTSELLGEHDVTDLLARHLRRACASLDAAAMGVLLGAPGEPLEVLSATSHAVTELEVFLSQVDEGPCVDCVNDGVDVVRVGADAIVGTWPTVGPAIVEAGYWSVYALPLVVQGRPIGGLNVFTAHDVAWDDEQHRLARTFADIVTLAVVQSSPRDQDELAARVHRVLEGRVAVEQAKGVLAYAEDLEMSDAYEHLLDLAHREGITVTKAARAVIDGAARRRSST